MNFLYSSLFIFITHFIIYLIVLLNFANGQSLAFKINDTNNWSKMCKANITEEELEGLFPKQLDKYLFASWSGLCGGLGNQMFRFASMYAIGKPYGRKPIFTQGQKCTNGAAPHESEGEHEMENAFPVYSSQIKYINLSEKENDTFYIKGAFAPMNSYEDPEKYALAKVKERYLKIDGKYFKAHKYFEKRRTEIRQIFQFKHELCTTVDTYRKELFGDDQSYKFCVHTRIGDFKNYGWETKKDFTEQGIEFGFEYLQKKFDNISVVLLGEDKQFLKHLKINRQLIANVYLPKAMPRTNDMAFATTACDSLLITAQTSTFAWWIAYLLPDNATIFYNPQVGTGDPYARDYFLDAWIPMEMSSGTRMNRCILNWAFFVSILLALFLLMKLLIRLFTQILFRKLYN